MVSIKILPAVKVVIGMSIVNAKNPYIVVVVLVSKKSLRERYDGTLTLSTFSSHPS